MKSSYVITVALAVSGLVGCKKNEEPPNTAAGYQPAQPGQQPYGQPGAYGGQGGYGQPAPYGTAPAPTATAPGQPAPVPGQPAPVPGGAGAPATGAPAAGGTAQPIDPSFAAAVQPVINEMARQHVVAGSKPVGSAIAGNFATGQTLETQVQLQPGKCYSVVASSLPPVQEVQVQFVALVPIPNMQPVLAQDQDTGTTAVLGKKPNCFKWAFPMAAPVKLVVQVTAGTGLVAAQLYEK